MWLYVCATLFRHKCRANVFVCSGGSIVADFARHKGGLLETARIHAAVRSDKQAESLSTLDVTVVKIDLSNPYALAGYMIRNDGEFGDGIHGVLY